jgi:HPt (histidine-containing phosphotransfer) domain-containing protein
VQHLEFVPPSAVAVSDVVAIIDQMTFKTLLRDVGAENARAVFGSFLAEIWQRLTLPRGLSTGSDRETIITEAHTIGGRRGTLGMADVSELARTLDKYADARRTMSARSGSRTRSC